MNSSSSSANGTTTNNRHQHHEKSTLGGRSMIAVDQAKVTSDPSISLGVMPATVSVASYNVLSTKKVQLFRSRYSHCIPRVLNFALRKVQLLKELAAADCDLCCLQSVDHFEDWWQPQLSLLGYDGVFNARTGGIPGEGVAIFFKRHLFQLFKTHVIDFSAVDTKLLTQAERLRRKKQRKSLPNNVGLIVGLQPWEKSTHPSAILVANVELDDGDDSRAVLKRNNQCLHFFHEIERFNAELHLPVVVCGSFNCTPGDATQKIISTGRIPYTKRLPDPPPPPIASSPSCSSIVLRWTKPRYEGDFPIIGYRLVRRSGGNEKMGFGKDLVVDAATFQVVVTGLSSGTVYEFKIAAITPNGTSPLSQPSKSLSTVAMRKNQPIFVHLKERVDAKNAAVHEASKGDAGEAGSTTMGNAILPPLSNPRKTRQNASQATWGGDGGATGLTPRFEDDRIITDVALSFDHTHSYPIGTKMQREGDEDVSSPSRHVMETKMTVVYKDGNPVPSNDDRLRERETEIFQQDPTVIAAAAAEEQRRTKAAMEGRNLPYHDLPLGEKFDNAVHSLNLHAAYSPDILPKTANGTQKTLYTMRGRDVTARTDYVLYTARRFRLSRILDLPDPTKFSSIDPRVRAYIPDPSKRKPDSWDDREYIKVKNIITGELEEVLNPTYRGAWEAPLVRNPASNHDRLPTAELGSDHLLLVACLEFQREYLTATWD